ncbi:hypothetical protein DFS34DRAFT_225768 [Phlyctochytrium arcticum]|nr:hypothetical protein DFS34DRAFT_225768 [Phlyctochytrium arcticum]
MSELTTAGAEGKPIEGTAESIGSRMGLEKRDTDFYEDWDFSLYQRSDGASGGLSDGDSARIEVDGDNETGEDAADNDAYSQEEMVEEMEEHNVDEPPKALDRKGNDVLALKLLITPPLSLANEEGYDQLEHELAQMKKDFVPATPIALAAEDAAPLPSSSTFSLVMSPTADTVSAIEPRANMLSETSMDERRPSSASSGNSSLKARLNKQRLIRLSASSSSMQWHATHRTYVYETVPSHSHVVADLLQQIKHEYEELTSEPMPPQRTQVPPSSPVARWPAPFSDDQEETAPVTVKKFHLPMGRPRYIQSLLLQVDDPKVKERLRQMHEVRESNAAAGVDVLVPFAVNEEKDEDMSHAWSTRPRSIRAESGVVLEEADEFGGRMRGVAMSGDVKQTPPSSAKTALSVNTAQSTPTTTAPSTADSLATVIAITAPPVTTLFSNTSRPVPPTRRSSRSYMRGEIPTHNTSAACDTWRNVRLLPAPLEDPTASKRRSPLTLNIPPPPRTAPPIQLTLLDRPLRTSPALSPIASSPNEEQEPVAVTSFVTPHHVAPARFSTAPGSITGPQLMSMSAKIRTVPLQQARDMHAIHRPLESNNVPWSSSKNYHTARQIHSESSTPLSSSRRATQASKNPLVNLESHEHLLYPSPPASPPQNLISPTHNQSRFGSLVRRVGKAFKGPPTISFQNGTLTRPTPRSPSSTRPELSPPVPRLTSSSIDSDRSFLTVDEPLSTWQDTDAADAPALPKKRSSEMEAFRNLLIEQYAAPDTPVVETKTIMAPPIILPSNGGGMFLPTATLSRVNTTARQHEMM